MIDQEIIERILNATDIVDVVKRYVELKKAGTDYVCCCPFHGEKTPSFHISPARQTWHCFGACNEGGNVLTFLMKMENLTFPEAVRKLGAEHGIEIEETQETAEQMEKRVVKDALLSLNERVCDWFIKQIQDPGNGAAWNYAVSRWGQEYVKETGIGYAPKGSQLREWAAGRGEKLDMLLELGLLRQRDDGSIYDFYRERIIIPIRDRLHRIIGFTARDLTNADGVPKYLNSKESQVYHKSSTVFGLDIAITAARRNDQFILVEGAADAMKMHSIGIDNVVAPLGGAWTLEQFKMLHKYTDNICFINDADVIPPGKRYGTGIELVLKNGERALEEHLNVTVRELPNGEGNTKQDPGTFFNARNKLSHLQEENFIVWACSKIFDKDDRMDVRTEKVKRIAAMAATIEDDMKVEFLLGELIKFNKGKDLWRQAINRVKWEAKRESEKKQGGVDLRQYGFFEQAGAYWTATEKGELQWSNFQMKPLFHIKDQDSPRRLYEFKNQQGRRDIVELTMEDLNSCSKFRQKIEGLGNYLWMGNDRDMVKLKTYLYDNTETASLVHQMGWDRKKGFYAFGNGIWKDGHFQKCDEFGICKLGDENFYIPAASKLYLDDTERFERERNFKHLNVQTVSMHDYLQKFIGVYGSNGKVALMYWCAALFRDIITAYTRNFPILNLFGPKGSGKTELGSALMSFFTIHNTPPSINNSTAVAMNNDCAFSSNALVHLDEYKNDIDSKRIEFLKGLFGGVGRTKMSGADYDTRIMTSVRSGIIMSGQEMPTADIALFNRCVFLSFPRSEFTPEEGKRFNELQEIQKSGCTGYTLTVLEGRKRIDSVYKQTFESVKKDIFVATDYAKIETRILENWAKILAAFKCLEDKVPWPMTYSEMLKITVDGIVNQNRMSGEGNEVTGFWESLAYMRNSGDIYEGSDYRIVTEYGVKTDTTNRTFNVPRKILYLNISRIFFMYKKTANNVGNKALPEDALREYIKNEYYYLGIKKGMRFKSIIHGYEEIVESPSPGKKNTVSIVARAMVFDYEQIEEKYGICLETDKLAVPDGPEEPKEPADEKK